MGLLHADPARAWNVASLSAACGIPRRTLERHFRNFAGRSPAAYLQKLRLERARKVLVRSPWGTSITAVASQCGFNHFGRFAKLYRRCYGESPSATINGARRSLVTRPPLARLLVRDLNRPAIAILPPDWGGCEVRQSDGVADTIAAALYSNGGLDVVAPSRARYHLRAHGRADDKGRLWVTIALIDVSSRSYRWAGHWDGTVDDMPSLESCISAGLARISEEALHETEIRSCQDVELGQLSAWELTMLALPKVHSFEPGMESRALEWLDRAMELVPGDPLPVAAAAWCRGQRASSYLVHRPELERDAARQLVKRGMSLHGGGSAIVHTMFAAACTLAHDLNDAATHAEKAIAMDGRSAWAWGRKGWVHACRGEVAAALDAFHVARKLGPTDSLNFLCSIGIASVHFEACRYDEAIHWYRRCFLEQPRAVLVNRFLAPSYMHSGRKEEARHSLGELMREFPDLTIEQVRGSLPHTVNFLDRAAEGLERAGMRFS
jgi:AraC-like DNA-binding protein/tetratricopeptide (TPR) repeat protein